MMTTFVRVFAPRILQRPESRPRVLPFQDLLLTFLLRVEPTTGWLLNTLCRDERSHQCGQSSAIEESGSFGG